VLVISSSFKLRYKNVNNGPRPHRAHTAPSVPRPHRAHTAPSVRAPRRVPRATNPITAALRGHHSVAGPGYIKVRHGVLETRSDPPSCWHWCSRLQLPKRVRAFSALHLCQTEAWAFSVFASTKGSGVLGLYPCEVRVFPALPPLNPRLGRSRPLPLQGTGVPGFASV